MSSFQFLHAADIHLDSPLRGLSAYPGAPAGLLRSATRTAFRNLVDFAIESRAGFVVIAGDLYDGDWRDYNTGIFFVEQAGRLAKEGIRLVLLRGNHDAESQITKTLRMPANVRRFGTRKAETIRFEELGVALHGRSFAQRDVTDNLAAGYPEPVSGMLNIGVLHTALEGNANHARYAPCSLDELLNRGYDYWALGHVHEREVLHENPWVVFSGNIQGRSIRETGAKGAMLVTCEDGAVVEVEPVDFDVVRWARIEVDCAGQTSVEDVLESVRASLDEIIQDQDHTMTVRVRLSGRSRVHGRLLRQEEQFNADVRGISAELGAERLWVEKIQIATEPETPNRPPGPIGDLQNVLDGAAADAGLQAAVASEFEKLRSKLPLEVRAAAEDSALSAVIEADPEKLIRELAPSLVARLLEIDK